MNYSSQIASADTRYTKAVEGPLKEQPPKSSLDLLLSQLNDNASAINAIRDQLASIAATLMGEPPQDRAIASGFSCNVPVMNGMMGQLGQAAHAQVCNINELGAVVRRLKELV